VNKENNDKSFAWSINISLAIEGITKKKKKKKKKERILQNIPSQYSI